MKKIFAICLLVHCCLSMSLFSDGAWETIESVRWHVSKEGWKAIEVDFFPSGDILWTGSEFLSVLQEENQILRSVNGIDWDVFPVRLPLRKIVKGEDVIVGLARSSTLVNMGDGLDWKEIELNAPGWLTDLAYGNGAWVVVGGSSIYSSENGLEWADRSATFGTSFEKVDYGNDLFVAVGNGGSTVSIDGVIWSHFPVSSFQDKSIVWFSFVKDRFFVSTVEGVFTSLDGVIWKRVIKFNLPNFPVEVRTIQFLSHRFHLIGNDSSGLIEYVSDDGEEWKEDRLLFNNEENDFNVTASNEALIVFDGNNTVFRSGNDHPMRRINGVAHGANRFVAVGSEGRIIHSVNGVEWDEVGMSGFDNDIWNVAFLGKHFLAVGSKGTILVSENGVDWRVTLMEHAKFLLGVASNQRRYVVVGANGDIRFSDDLESWDVADIFLSNGEISPLMTTLRSVEFGGGTFVAVGHDGTILRSSDGRNWEVISQDSVDELNSVTYGNGRFVAVSTNGLVLVSSNGRHWTRQSTGEQRALSAVRFINGVFVAMSYEGEMLVSSDGMLWHIEEDFQIELIRDIASDGERLIAVGVGGNMLSSTLFPSISQPTNEQFVQVGERWSVSLNVESALDLTYQWYKNGLAMPGETNGVLSAIGKITDTGSYQLEVFDGYRSVRSLGVRLTVEGDYIDWLDGSSYNNDQLKDLSLVSVDADPGGYGIPNLLRYVFSYDPHKPERFRPVVLRKAADLFYNIQGNWLMLEFPRLRRDPDVRYLFESSSNLVDWDDLLSGKDHWFYSDGEVEALLIDEEKLSTDNTFFRLRAEGIAR